MRKRERKLDDNAHASIGRNKDGLRALCALSWAKPTGGMQRKRIERNRPLKPRLVAFYRTTHIPCPADEMRVCSSRERERERERGMGRTNWSERARMQVSMQDIGRIILSTTRGTVKRAARRRGKSGWTNGNPRKRATW
jgi:hypothetical protein